MFTLLPHHQTCRIFNGAYESQPGAQWYSLLNDVLLILNMSANKRGRKQPKPSEGYSTSSAEKRADKSMETYEDTAHDMATSWTNI
jgi:hypothetical protein